MCSYCIYRALWASSHSWVLKKTAADFVNCMCIHFDNQVTLAAFSILIRVAKCNFFTNYETSLHPKMDQKVKLSISSVLPFTFTRINSGERWHFAILILMDYFRSIPVTKRNLVTQQTQLLVLILTFCCCVQVFYILTSFDSWILISTFLPFSELPGVGWAIFWPIPKVPCSHLHLPDICHF